MLLSKRNFVVGFSIFLILYIAFGNYALASEASSQNLDLYPDISHIDNDNSSTITIGDELKIGTESFYVLSYSNNTIRALSKYNLDVGLDCTNSVKVEKTNPSGLQNPLAKGSSGSTNIGTGNGTVPYSNGDLTYENSTVKTYVDAYANLLTSTYNISLDADLITYQELIDLGFKSSYGNTGIYSNYKWLYSTSYWIKTGAWYVTYDGFFNRISSFPDRDDMFGVRPVINISDTYFKNTTFNLNSDENGSLNISNESTKVLINATPKEGYAIDELSVNSTSNNYILDRSSPTNFSFTVINQDDNISINVTFKKIENYQKFDGSFIWPCDNRVVTSRMKQRWGRWHKGIDVGANYENVYASAAGYAFNLYDRNGYGYYTMIFHDENYVTLYGHLSQQITKDGQYVSQGDVIALSGNSGSSTGPHLHFEIRKANSFSSYFNAQFYNPLDFLSGNYEILDGGDVTTGNPTTDQPNTNNENNTLDSKNQIMNYKVLDGENQIYQLKSENGLTIKTNGDISKFVKLLLDNKTVDAKNYTIQSGSTIVTLNSTFLDTLSEGLHTLTFSYTDGEVSTNLTIAKSTTPTPSGEKQSEDKESEKINQPDANEIITSIKNPKTEDNVLTWINLIFFSLLGLYFIKKQE